jgi:hypothetical protein
MIVVIGGPHMERSMFAAIGSICHLGGWVEGGDRWLQCLKLVENRTSR